MAKFIKKNKVDTVDIKNFNEYMKNLLSGKPFQTSVLKSTPLHNLSSTHVYIKKKIDRQNDELKSANKNMNKLPLFRVFLPQSSTLNVKFIYDPPNKQYLRLDILTEFKTKQIKCAHIYCKNVRKHFKRTMYKRHV